MEAKEFDELLSDLETRVDRLRALYENWFRGYERQEPMVARKDCDRRVYGLRKEVPRSTVLRYRYNMLFQRYTTLVSYWQRTARQIEEGTYRLQLQRLRRKKQRRGDEVDLDAASPDGHDSDRRRPREEQFELDLDESFDVNDLLDSTDLDAVASAVNSRPSVPSRAPNAPSRVPNAPSRVPNAPSQPAAPPAPSAPTRTAATFARPGALSRVPVEPSAGAQQPVPRAPGNGEGPPPSVPRAAPPAPPPPPMRSPGAAVTTQAGIAGLPAPPTVFGPPASRPQVPPPPPPAASLSRRPSGEIVRPGITASGVRLTTNADQAARPAPPSAPSSPTSLERGIHQDRLRDIYREYAAARRNNQEGEVRYETMVGSINKMLPELQKKHGGKEIDFDVVVKDGRVGLKPRAK